MLDIFCLYDFNRSSPSTRTRTHEPLFRNTEYPLPFPGIGDVNKHAFKETICYNICNIVSV